MKNLQVNIVIKRHGGRTSPKKTGPSTSRTKTQKIITSRHLSYFGNFPNTILHPHRTWRHFRHKTRNSQRIVSHLSDNTRPPPHRADSSPLRPASRIACPNRLSRAAMDAKRPHPEMPWPSLIPTSPSASKRNTSSLIVTHARWPTPPRV